MTSAAVADPFACFGSDDDDSVDSTTADSDHHHHGTTPNLKQQQQQQVLEHAEIARNLVQQSNDSTETADDRLIQRYPISRPTSFEVFDLPQTKDNPGPCKGLRATKVFLQGEEIMRETAVMRIPNHQAASSADEAKRKHQSAVWKSFQGLHPTTQKEFMDLSSCKEPADAKTPHGVYDTNSYCLTGEAERSDTLDEVVPVLGGLFLTVARMNHSCRPSATHFWRPDLEQTVVFASRDIAVGEELCTRYGPADCLPTAGRRDFLDHHFAFWCQCGMCAEEERETGGDARMLEIQSLQEDIDLLASTGKSALALTAVQTCLTLLEQQGIGYGVFTKPILRFGYEMSLATKDYMGAHKYLSEELLAVQQSEGVDSPRALQIQNEITRYKSIPVI